MKSFIVSGIICFIFIAFGFSQEYIPFKTGHVGWKSLWNYADCSIGIPCYKQILYVNGEVNINDLIYARLYFYEDDNGLIRSGYIGGFRNDINEKKVYYIRYNETEEKLLYDFDMIPGDTVVAPNDTAVCLAIDSILIGDKYRRRFYMRSVVDDGTFRFDYDIIEGIGSTNGLLFGPNTDRFESGSHWLVCYQEDGEAVYNPGNSDYYCEDLLPLNDALIGKPSTIFPNPATNYFSIDQPGYPSITVQVISLAGEVVMTRQYAHHEKIRVPVGDLAPGTYLVRLISNDQVSVQKLSVVK